ncbi:MAG: NADP-dependent succinic semialdehyde dehydrogenase [Promethearchaeota archaeon]
MARELGEKRERNQEVKVVSQEVLQVFDKYTGELIDSVPADTKATLAEKVRRVAKAGEALGDMDFFERAQWLGKVATRLRFKKKELKELVVAEGGLPVKYSEWELSIVINGFKFCEWYDQFVQERPLTNVGGEPVAKLRHVPRGLAACVGPRNTPISLPLYMLGANYLVGNPSIVKPSTACPLTMHRAVELMADVGLPALDSTKLVVAPGDWAVDEFLRNDLVRTLLVVSASHTAKDILVRYARMLRKSADKSMGVAMYSKPFKHFIFECAGNDAGIVMDDVNLERVAKWNVQASFTNSGQQCFSMKRIIVHQDVYDDYVEALIRETEKLKWGDPRDPSVDIGPLGSRRILMMMEVMVADARDHGAPVLTGGGKVDPGGSHGLFFEPTLVEIRPELCEDLSKAPFLWREEAFGPVRSVTKATDLRDAIRLANASHYGMRAVVYCADQSKVPEFVRRLDAGSIYVNAKPMLTDITVAMGGIKDSAFPAGAKYYPQDLVYQKYVYDGSAQFLDDVA